MPGQLDCAFAVALVQQQLVNINKKTLVGHENHDNAGLF
jgi:hypothetical protein